MRVELARAGQPRRETCDLCGVQRQVAVGSEAGLGLVPEFRSALPRREPQDETVPGIFNFDVSIRAPAKGATADLVSLSDFVLVSIRAPASTRQEKIIRPRKAIWNAALARAAAFTGSGSFRRIGIQLNLGTRHVASSMMSLFQA